MPLLPVPRRDAEHRSGPILMGATFGEILVRALSVKLPTVEQGCASEHTVAVALKWKLHSLAELGLVPPGFGFGVDNPSALLTGSAPEVGSHPRAARDFAEAAPCTTGLCRLDAA